MIANRTLLSFLGVFDLFYWIKWIIAYTSIRIYNILHSKKRFDDYDVNSFGDPEKCGFIVPDLETELESPFPESHLQEASDEVLLYGVNSKSECVLVRIARGANQVSDAWIYVKLANGKTYYLSESKGYQQPFEGKCHNFSCGNLQMHYLAPMRRWRIFYCGMLKEMSGDNSSTETVFVKFVFLWKASSDVYDLTLGSNPEGFINAVARREWESSLVPPIKKVVDATNLYAQSGVINGTICVDDGDDYELYLFGERMRNLGKTRNIVMSNFINILGNVPGNGFTFHLGRSSVPYIFKNLSYGFIVQPDGTLKAVKEWKINDQPDDSSSEHLVNCVLTAGDRYEIRGRVIGDPINLGSGKGPSGFMEASFIEFTVGNKKGSGLFFTGEIYKEPEKPTKNRTKIAFPNPVPLTVPFTDGVSQFEDISGGKGSSLGKLTKLSQDVKTFKVPKGLVVTTASYRQFLTSEILEAVKHLENVAYGNIDGDVKEACSLASDVIVKTVLPTKICNSIAQNLKHLFGDEIQHHKFAVRSSATGEDTASMSAAGQMDTFLGVQGLEEIFLAVKKCWASQFGHIAVEYKKRYGQILNCPMAVVIQEMVPSEVSGVLFTCDPVTNNPSVITITANYGLGETVVSGSVEPDTIILKRDTNGQLQYDSVLVGAKHQKLVMQESGGTVIEDIPEDAREDSCLTKELAERLGKLSLQIEDYYRTPRDIEWGIVNETVYILQSRPVTNAAAETEFEMKHELDAPLRCENEYFTVANVGEVMSGASSPLGLDIHTKFFRNVFKKLAAEKGIVDNILSSKYYCSGLLTFYNHLMATVVELVARYGFDTPRSRGFAISIFGRILDDPDLLEYVREKVPPGEDTSKKSILQTIRFYLKLFFHDWNAEKTKRKLEKYHFNFLNYSTAKETFAEFLKSCNDFDEGGIRLIDSTESSSEWNMSMFQILSDAKKGKIDSDVYSDFARLLTSSSNVESANVPQALQEVADHLFAHINGELFRSLSVEDAWRRIKKSTSVPGEKFREFLKRHGHRCLNEFDVHSITWGMDPKILVQLLQNLSKASSGKEKVIDNDYDTLFSDLHVKLGFFSKCKLRFVLPNCHKAVRGREAGKSLCITGFHYWRKGCRHLARQMVAEGRIPDEDLLFFMPLTEIKELLETRSPNIISRAMNRRKMLPTLDKYIFPEIMKGIPKPINESDESAETYEFVADLTMKGIPVSQGVTKGFARVAVTLEEASHLQRGEILITYCTDIGWTPYFPVISGVVTELGGLVSHGAVVSREYGLPCVVGMQGATRRFQTGDYVLLDGKKGILQRLPKPEH